MANRIFTFYMHPSIRVEDFPARGKGYRASCPISRGSLLLQEAPLFRLPANASEDQINPKLAELKAGDRELFHQLFVSPQLIAKPTLGKFRANALECVDHQTGGSSAGLFVHGARFNSSCTPNVHYVWDGNTMSFKTLKHIQAGEELCIAYDLPGVLFVRDQRKSILFNMDGFHCACFTCVTNDAASDQRRNLIRNASAKRDQPGYNMIMIWEALQALDQEKLYLYRDKFLYDGFKTCAYAGDVNNAMLWLKAAYEATVNVTRERDPRLEEMKALLSDPYQIVNMRRDKQARLLRAPPALTW